MFGDSNIKNNFLSLFSMKDSRHLYTIQNFQKNLHIFNYYSAHSLYIYMSVCVCMCVRVCVYNPLKAPQIYSKKQLVYY